MRVTGSSFRDVTTEPTWDGHVAARPSCAQRPRTRPTSPAHAGGRPGPPLHPDPRLTPPQTHAHTHAHTCMCARAHAHTYTHVHTHSHVHTQTCPQGCCPGRNTPPPSTVLGVPVRGPRRRWHSHQQRWPVSPSLCPLSVSPTSYTCEDRRFARRTGGRCPGSGAAWKPQLLPTEPDPGHGARGGRWEPSREHLYFQADATRLCYFFFQRM